METTPNPRRASVNMEKCRQMLNEIMSTPSIAQKALDVFAQNAHKEMEKALMGGVKKAGEVPASMLPIGVRIESGRLTAVSIIPPVYMGARKK